MRQNNLYVALQSLYSMQSADCPQKGQLLTRVDDKLSRMKALAFVVFLLMPTIGLLFSLRIWLFLRSGLRVTARIIGYKEERWNGGIDTDNSSSLPIVSFRDERGREQRVTLSQERPIKWKGLRDDEIRLIYRRGDPQHPKIAHWSLLWMVPMFLFAPAIILLIALGWLILSAKLAG